MTTVLWTLTHNPGVVLSVCKGDCTCLDSQMGHLWGSEAVTPVEALTGPSSLLPALAALEEQAHP